MVEFKDIECRGKKYMYCPKHKDYDVLDAMKTAAQLIITDIKMGKLRQRKDILLCRLSVNETVFIHN
jgi:hypothetical protein